MTPMLLFSVAVSISVGVLLLRVCWPEARWPWPLALALGTGLGAGASSALLFLWLLAFGPLRGFAVGEVGLLALLAWRATRVPWPAPAAARFERRLQPVTAILAVAGMGTLLLAAAAFGANLRQQPHGGWDAWMNWDLRARMIFRGGDGWRAAFSSTFPWSHPDYPPMVPSLVVRAWLYAGRETLLGPGLMATAFTFGTAALLLTALGTLRDWSLGLLATIVLLSTPFFILHGTSLYADVPLSFFFLATFVGLALDDRVAGRSHRFATLAGVAAGLAMWTKNEGLVFGLALSAGLLLQAKRGGWTASRGRLLAFALGLIPALTLVAGFKVGFPQPNDLLSTLGLERTLDRVTDLGRYALVAREYGRHTLSFGANGAAPALVPLLACAVGLGLDRAEQRRAWVRTAAVTLALLLAAHFVVFVSMADELARLLASSLDRLLLQVWPSALFLLFMVLRSPDAPALAPVPATPRELGARAEISS